MQTSKDASAGHPRHFSSQCLNVIQTWSQQQNRCVTLIVVLIKTVTSKEKKKSGTYSTSLLVFEGFQFANRFKQNNHFGYIFVDFLKLYV